MVRKYLPVIVRAILIGVPIAISMAVLYLLVLMMLWWNIQGSFGHSMFHHLEPFVMGAEYTQGYSLLIVLSLLAGALTTYVSRSFIKNSKSALIAGAITGLVIVSTFCLAAVNLVLMIGPGGSAAASIMLYIQYLAMNLLTVLFVSLVVPGVFTLPFSAIGGFIGRLNLVSVERQTDQSPRPYYLILLSIVAGILTTGLMSALISQAYNIPVALPCLFSLPLLISLPLLAAASKSPVRIMSVPVFFWILALAILIIVLVPMAAIIVACQTGIIYVPPYDWEYSLG